MVDLTRDKHRRTRARLLDLVPGGSGNAYATWLQERGPAFRAEVQVAALDPFAGYKTATDDHLEDVTAVLDAFHVVRLGTAAVDEIRRSIQQDTLSGIEAATATRSTGSRTSSAPGKRTSPRSNALVSSRRGVRSRPGA